ncbi:hypothetical protein EDD16DRAFT_1495550 [Pisolithus croceorrhizus]|nr:hypothetical protein EDD16DRAFT_1495550 [Pisolithus croceorrhizus]KAI6114700.1 hypothetical protein EV401DRAFT_1865945 [Pisolithus croceorrhizus]KAI6159206.1 hypothetical protein EDD17DRAFT_1487161 [Pisolithus thermaeus]
MAHEPPTAPAAMSTLNKKRPKIDLTVQTGERRRGKSMFGIVLGTLNKAKLEDRERNASEAAKKRHLLEQRLQAKLQKETDSVRRAEEAKKDKTTANRKEEELQLKDSIYKLRRIRLPLLSNFLSTSDIIPSDLTSTTLSEPLAPLPRSHPPPLYYRPAILTPSQDAFLAKRQVEVVEAAEKEWLAFREERTIGIEEIKRLRQRVAEEEARQRKEREADKQETPNDSGQDKEAEEQPVKELESEMEVDEERRSESAVRKEDVGRESDRKDEPALMQADDEDAVEY